MTRTESPAEQALDEALEQALRLENQLCFAVHAASRAFDGLYRVTLREAGLTYPQYLAMLVLWEQGEVTVKELGQHLRLDSGTLSPLLRRLEAAGFVERRRGVHDERSVSVRATESGNRLRARVCAVPGKTAASTGIELTEMLALRDRLNDLTESLDAYTAALAGPGEGQ